MKLEMQNWFDENKWPYLVVVLSLILVTFMVIPLFDSMILGLVFAYVARPIRDLFGNRRIIGSLVATFCIVIPIFIIMMLGAFEIGNQLVWLADHKQEMLGLTSGFISSLNIPSAFFNEITGSLESIMDVILSAAATMPIFRLGKSFSMGLLNFVLSFPICYFLLVDGKGLKDFLMGMLPPKKLETNKKYFANIDRILSGIFIGNIYTSVAAGLVSVLIFYLFDVPRPLAMASIVILAGLVPFLTWLVFIPTSIYKYFELGIIDALAFFLVGSILVHLAELLIRPYFVSAKSSLHPMLVMITFIGGGLVAGIGGFFLAPALTGLVYAVYQVTQEERLDVSRAQEDGALEEFDALKRSYTRPPS